MSRSIRRRVSGAIAFLALASSASAVTVAVTSAADAGAGSFRDAVSQANGNAAIDAVVFAPDLGTIVFSIANGSVVYTGEQSLTVDGNGAVITDQAGGAFDLFQSTGGADLSLREITFDGGGANGATVGIPGDRTGEVRVELDHVTFSDNARFGLLVDDGVGNSDAGVYFSAAHTWITGNGSAVPPAENDDTDGVRINERAIGGIAAHQDTWVSDNLYDGVELDETGDGNVTASCRRSTFENNGDGNPADLEDGIDIDETGGGSLDVDIFQCSALGNHDEGFDFNEGDAGDSTIRMLQAVADGNEARGSRSRRRARATSTSWRRTPAPTTATVRTASRSRRSDRGVSRPGSCTRPSRTTTTSA